MEYGRHAGSIAYNKNREYQKGWAKHPLTTEPPSSRRFLKGFLCVLYGKAVW
jgi:hypothetical protein